MRLIEIVLSFVLVLLAFVQGTRLFAQEHIPNGSTVIDFEGSYENPYRVFMYPHGVDFFDVWVEVLDVVDENGFIPNSGSHLLMGDGKFGIYAYFNQSVTGEVSSVGGFFSGIGGVLTAFDENGNVLGESKTKCCDFVSNQMLFVESKATPIYLVIFSRKVRYSMLAIDDFFFSSRKIECKIDVPLYLQTDPLWKNDKYGQVWWSERSPYRTIEYEGCAVTSSAMVLSYYGRKTNGISVDPHMLNVWLREHPMGYVGGNVNWFYVAKYAREVLGVDLWYRGHDRNDSSILSDRLCSGAPMILELNGHFVVATGILGDSWLINDPLSKASALDEYYGNWFKSTRRFAIQKKDSRDRFEKGYLIIDSNAEFDFHVISPTNEVFYSSGDDKNIEIISPINGKYSIVIDSQPDKPDALIYVASENASGFESMYELGFVPLMGLYFDDASHDPIKVLSSLFLPVVTR